MSTQPQRRPGENPQDRPGPPEPEAPAAAGGGVQGSKSTEELDSLLDEIDTVLESNAEEFVKGFVQKGGQ